MIRFAQIFEKNFRICQSAAEKIDGLSSEQIELQKDSSKFRMN
jgi:hypothetical protein